MGGPADLAGLVEHHLDVAGILAELGGHRDGPLAGDDLAQPPGASLGLGDELVGDHDHVIGGRRLARGGQGIGDQLGRLVAVMDLGNAGEGAGGDHSWSLVGQERLRSSWRSMPRVCAAPPRVRSSVASTSARSSGVSMSSASDGTSTVSTWIPAAVACSRWR